MEYEKIKDTLLAAVDTGLKFAQSIDKKSQFEIYLYYRNNSNIVIKQGVVEATDGIIAGTAVRAAKDQRVSFSSSSGISPDRIKRSLKGAISSLKAVPEKDERFKGFCEPKPPGKEGKFASEILSLSTEDLVKFALQIIGDMTNVKGQILGASECNLSWGGFAIGNTEGLQQASRSVYNTCSAYAIAIDGEDRKTASEELVTRAKAIDVSGLGEKAAKKAIDLLGAKKLGKTTSLPTLWVPWAAASYILSSLQQSVRGSNVVEGLSPLSQRLNEKIAAPCFTLIDDGQDPLGISTEAIDAEGHPQGQTIIIKNGTLKSFLFDSYYGRITGRGSTGNSIRVGQPLGSSLPYENAPSILSKNLKVFPGKYTEEELIASIDGKALLISDIPIGIFHTMVATGEFSAIANSVYLIENGEKKTPLKSVSVAGNFFKGLEQLRGIGNNVEITSLDVTTPSLLFDGFSITG
ncbi:MAG: TldD/PmbA family protein [Candidatus Thorarchaeota archaeon]